MEEDDGSFYCLIIDDETDIPIGICSVEFAERLLDHPSVMEYYKEVNKQNSS